jgi:hypothetical protein
MPKWRKILEAEDSYFGAIRPADHSPCWFFFEAALRFAGAHLSGRTEVKGTNFASHWVGSEDTALAL